MLKRMLCIGLLILLVACTEEQVIVKKDSPPKNPNENPEFVEKKNDDKEEVDEFIEFALPNEEVMINLGMVPILNEFLHATKNREQAIKKMNLLRIHVTDRNLYLLEFSCENQMCSYLILDQTKDNQAYLVADLAKLIQTKFSPNNSKILIHFNRKVATTTVPFSDIVVIDLEKWELIQLKNLTNDTKLLNYKWPIVTAEWKGDKTFSVLQPDIKEPTTENIERWQKGDKPTKSVEFMLKKD